VADLVAISDDRDDRDRPDARGPSGSPQRRAVRTNRVPARSGPGRTRAPRPHRGQRSGPDRRRVLLTLRPRRAPALPKNALKPREVLVRSDQLGRARRCTCRRIVRDPEQGRSVTIGARRICGNVRSWCEREGDTLRAQSVHEDGPQDWARRASDRSSSATKMASTRSLG
jgi:hypothetical protein